MKLTNTLPVLALQLAACQAATITLYAVETQAVTDGPSNEFTITPIGTAADGAATTYLEHAVVSVFVEEPLNTDLTIGGVTLTAPPPSTRTYTSDAMTIDGTIVADASHYVLHQDPPKSGWSGASISCDLDGKGGGSCVQAYWIDNEPTGTTSYTGTVAPIATFVADDKKGDTKGNGASASSGAGYFMGAVVSAIVGVLFL